MDKNRYNALKAMGRCVICGKNKADEGYVTCLVCRMNNREKGDTHSEESKQKHKMYLKRRRDIMYAFGVCVVCGKHDAEKGSSTCGICKAKSRARSAEKRLKEGVMPRSLMDGYKHCAWCNSTEIVKGQRLCAKHYEIAKKNMSNARQYKKEPNLFEMRNTAYWNEIKYLKEKKADTVNRAKAQMIFNKYKFIRKYLTIGRKAPPIQN